MARFVLRQGTERSRGSQGGNRLLRINLPADRGPRRVRPLCHRRDAVRDRHGQALGLRRRHDRHRLLPPAPARHQRARAWASSRDPGWWGVTVRPARRRPNCRPRRRSMLDCNPLDREVRDRVIARCLVAVEDIGARMVSEGPAWAYTEYSDDYVALEAEARVPGGRHLAGADADGGGVKGRRLGPAERAAPGGCPIKGSINGGNMIYHTSWSPNYGR